MNASDLRWRLELDADCRPKQLDRILVNLMICFPNCASVDLPELAKMSELLEEEAFVDAISYTNYLHRVYVKLLRLETRFSTTDGAGNHGTQSQVGNQGQSQISLPNQYETQQQLATYDQSYPDLSAGAQDFANLPPALQSMTGLTQTSVPDIAGLFNMQSGTAQDFVGSSVSQDLSSNFFSNKQWQMPDQLQQFSSQEQQLLPQHQLTNDKHLQPAQMSNAVGRSTNTQSEIAHAQDLFQQQQKKKQKQQQQQQKQQQQLTNPQPFPSSVNSNAQTGQNADDLKEEIYHKIKAMKQSFLPYLMQIYQKAFKEYQQLERNVSVSNVPQSERQKLMDLLYVLEKHMNILNMSKDSINPDMKGRLSDYEKKVIHVIKSNWSREPVSAQQQIQQSGGHRLSTQPQQQQPQQQQQPHQQQQQQQQQEEEEVDNQPHATHEIVDVPEDSY